MERDSAVRKLNPTSKIWTAALGFCLGALLAVSGFHLETKEVMVTVGDVSFEMGTQAQDVAGILSELGLSPHDFRTISPNPRTRVTGGMEVVLTRESETQVAEDYSSTSAEQGFNFSVEYQTERVAVPYKVIQKPAGNLEVGTQQVLVQGKEGWLERTRKLVYKEDKFITDVLIREVVLSEPTDHVVLIGTKQPVKTVATAEGTYRYQTVKDMLATAYYPGPESTAPFDDGFTAIGLRAGYGIVAVDPKVIPLRSKVYIPGYGVAIAGDVGGAIKGDRVDLCYETIEEAIAFGRKRVKVYILD